MIGLALKATRLFLKGIVSRENSDSGVPCAWTSPPRRFVCKKCNETWMSDIEARISTSFSQIIRFGPSVSILQRGVSLLAAFAFEKQVIADHMHLKGGPFFKFADRDLLRESLAVSAGVQIWLATLQGRGPYKLF